MPRGRGGLVVLGLVGLALAWILFVALPQWYSPDQATTLPGRAADGSGGEVRRIHATLYYVAADGLSLATVEREVPYGEHTVEQARRILEEQLRPAPPPLMSAIPDGTALRHVFVTERGQAFVDLSPEIVERHTGGSLDELFTVYSIVNALTTNLPAIQAVQILIDGREADTLAGHVDLRNPLTPNLRWVGSPGSGTRPASPEAGF